MSINEISNELILEIFDRVDDPGTLHQLSLCSKRMNDLANSIIYKSFKQRKNSDLPIFFKTILKHPHLAETVKQIDINIREMSLVWIEIENDLLRRAIRSICDGLAEEELGAWMAIYNSDSVSHELASRGWDPILALLLLSLPKIESFAMYGLIRNNWKLRPQFLSSILKRAADLQRESIQSPLALNNLESYSISGPRNSSGIPEICGFQKLNSIRKIRIRGIIRFFRDHAWMLVESRAVELELVSIRLGFANMVDLVRCFPRLERFTWEHHTLPLSQMLPVLSVVKGTIRHLVLSAPLQRNVPYFPISTLFQVYPPQVIPTAFNQNIIGANVAQNPINWFPTIDSQGLGSLLDFTNLEQLDTTISVLTGDHGLAPPFRTHRLCNILPPSLKHLTLRRCAVYDSMDDLKEMAAVGLQTLPNLKEICVFFSGSPNELLRSAWWNTLTAKFIAKGVVLTAGLDAN